VSSTPGSVLPELSKQISQIQRSSEHLYCTGRARGCKGMQLDRHIPYRGVNMLGIGLPPYSWRRLTHAKTATGQARLCCLTAPRRSLVNVNYAGGRSHLCIALSRFIRAINLNASLEVIHGYGHQLDYIHIKIRERNRKYRLRKLKAFLRHSLKPLQELAAKWRREAKP
jgi:hypothetical protein